MPAAGYAYAIDPRIIDKSLKRRLIVKAQNKKFVQCVSPSYFNSRKSSITDFCIYALRYNYIHIIVFVRFVSDCNYTGYYLYRSKTLQAR